MFVLVFDLHVTARYSRFDLRRGTQKKICRHPTPLFFNLKILVQCSVGASDRGLLFSPPFTVRTNSHRILNEVQAVEDFQQSDILSGAAAKKKAMSKASSKSSIGSVSMMQNQDDAMMDGIDDEGNPAESMGGMDTEVASDDELNAAPVPDMAISMAPDSDQSYNRTGVVPGADDFLCSGLCT